MERKKYYINRDCVFSTLEKALEHEKMMREHDEEGDESEDIYICYLDEHEPYQIGFFHRNTEEFDIINW